MTTYEVIFLQSSPFVNWLKIPKQKQTTALPEVLHCSIIVQYVQFWVTEKPPLFSCFFENNVFADPAQVKRKVVSKIKGEAKRSRKLIALYEPL